MTIIYLLGWLLPVLVYLFVFSDPPKTRLIWVIITLVFSWLGLLARFIFGLVK